MFDFAHVNDAEPFLVDKLSGKRFLESAGGSSNSSMFVAPYPPSQQEEAARMVAALKGDLAIRGVEAVVVDLFDLFCSIHDEQGLWEPYCDIEATTPPARFIMALKDAADLETQILPRLAERAKDPAIRLLIVTGMGACYPVIHTHQLVELLMERGMRVPVLIMFPGRQTVRPDGSTSLDILATPPGEGGPKYRARNIFSL